PRYRGHPHAIQPWWLTPSGYEDDLSFRRLSGYQAARASALSFALVTSRLVGGAGAASTQTNLLSPRRSRSPPFDAIRRKIGRAPPASSPRRSSVFGPVARSAT